MPPRRDSSASTSTGTSVRTFGSTSRQSDRRPAPNPPTVTPNTIDSTQISSYRRVSSKSNTSRTTADENDTHRSSSSGGLRNSNGETDINSVTKSAHATLNSYPSISPNIRDTNPRIPATSSDNSTKK